MTSPSAPPTAFDITFPQRGREVDQDEEWFEAAFDGTRHRMRVHDYASIYQIPGLYEALVYETLRCRSPERIVNLLMNVLPDWPTHTEDLRALDLGAGNGIVAQELRRAGVPFIVGLDLLPEAAVAARRDRPGVYDDYLVADLCDLAAEDRGRLADARLNCLVTVAALGFGDIPANAFASAFNLISQHGWLAMTIKEDFLSQHDDDSGFAKLIRQMVNHGTIEIQAHHRYCHRISISGEKLFYVAAVARKQHHVAPEVVEAIVAGERASVAAGGTTAGSAAAALLGS